MSRRFYEFISLFGLMSALLVGCNGGVEQTIRALPDASPLTPGDGGVVISPGEDAGVVTPEPDGGMPEETAPEVYSSDRTLSPMTPHVVQNLREIAARGDLDDNVFAKIGASASKSLAFMHCFAEGQIDWDGRDELQEAVDHFLGGDASGSDPFSRESEATVVGWDAGDVQSGSPSPLLRELDALDPAFGVVMYGTNDINTTGIYGYGSNMLDLVDTLLERGTIPVLTTIMPRDDNADADLWVPRFNHVVRAIAEDRQIPMIDYHRELLPLSDHGISSDGIHPTAFFSGGRRAC